MKLLQFVCCTVTWTLVAVLIDHYEHSFWIAFCAGGLVGFSVLAIFDVVRSQKLRDDTEKKLLKEIAEKEGNK